MGERDPVVRIVDYDPAWPEEAAPELARVGAALGALAVRLAYMAGKDAFVKELERRALEAHAKEL
ncbi:MAG: hypothetical protein JSS68_19310 [Actinobacteria bacterium]|nr:hypothetical protein [Actinomycetota bacterium]